MKKNILIVSLLAPALLFQSCKTQEKFEVVASPSQKIYLPGNYTPVNDPYKDGAFDMKVPSAYCLGYMTTVDPATGLRVPFGLDFHKKNHSGAMGVGVTEILIGSYGAIAGIIGYAFALTDDSDLSTTGGIMLGIGAPVAGLGLGLGCAELQKSKQLTYEYNFAYDKQQKPYSGKLSKTLLNPNPPKQTESAAPRRKAVSGDSTVNVAATTTPAGTTIAKKSRKATVATGTFAASGKLFKGTAVDEEYPEMQLVIAQGDNGAYNVSVIESGEDFFGAPLVFEYSGKDDLGASVLKLHDLPTATLTLMPDGRILFRHPAVLIDGEPYTLSINGKK